MAEVFRVTDVSTEDSNYDEQSTDNNSDLVVTDESGNVTITADVDQSDADTDTDVDELLSPVARLEKYSDNEITFNRQVVARNIVDTLRSVIGNTEDVSVVLAILQKLSKDPEPSVRAEVMEQVPHIAVFCNEFTKQLGYVIIQYLVPMVVQYFSDSSDQVRKTSQAALLVLFEQGLIDKSVIEEQVCPVIFQLTEPDSFDNYRTEGVALMIKLAPLLGTELTLELFLDRFSALCTDSLFLVRKVCAANFGDFCSVVGVETTEKVLLSKFYYLCEDGVWDVRKACSEVFMSVSCACSLETRKHELASLFINLLCDPSRWVKMSAFQTLGPFISTFADPVITGLYYKEDGVLCINEPAKQTCQDEKQSKRKETKSEGKTTQEVSKPQHSNELEKQEPTEINEDKEDDTVICEVNTLSESMDLSSTSEGPERCLYNPVDSEGDELSIEENFAKNRKTLKSEVIEAETSQSCSNGANSSDVCDINQSNPSENVSNEDDPAQLEEGSLQLYESFNYWRVPLPQIELDSETNGSVRKKKSEESDVSNLTTKLKYAEISDKPDGNFQVLNYYSPESNQRTYRVHNSDVDSAIGISPSEFSSPFCEPNSHYDSIMVQQEIVPSDLLNHFLSMTDPSYITSIDTDITRHCAYSIPAVALTLGRNHWQCLKNTYESLSSDIQWKVRHTLASSIHELALILGEDIATKDLIPIFNGFIKDLDEVRIGILRHLSDFLKFLRPEDRREYLPKLAEFIKTDNERNWRFRHELAQQLLMVPELYAPAEVKEYIVPITLCLVNDKVSEVRKKAYQVMAVILKHLAQDEELVKPVLYDLTNQFCRSRRWLRRQIYALLCRTFLEYNSVPQSMYSIEVLPHLLDLSWDPVPNVRIAVAQCVSQEILKSDYLMCSDLRCHDFLLDAVKVLQTDSDRDVNYYAHFSINAKHTSLDPYMHMVLPV